MQESPLELAERACQIGDMRDLDRIHITGASGAGVTTLGRALSAHLGMPCFDTDDYYWLPTNPPYEIKREVAERLSMLANDLSGLPRWVLSGSIDSWGQSIIAIVSLVIYLDTPTDVRLQRLRKRETERFGDNIAAGGSMFEKNQAFMNWAAEYDRGECAGRNRVRHARWLAGLSQPVIRCDGTKTTNALLQEIIGAPGLLEPGRQPRIY
jgi:adenylate kinase family enzyme